MKAETFGINRCKFHNVVRNTMDGVFSAVYLFVCLFVWVGQLKITLRHARNLTRRFILEL